MTVRHLAALACIALGIAGCKKEAAAPVAKPSEAKAPEPAAAPVAAPRQDFATTDSTLSLLEPVSGHCEWLKLDAFGGRMTVASFEGNCVGGEVALSKDGKRGLVRFNPQALRGTATGKSAFAGELLPGPAKDRLFEVDVIAGTSRELPVPKLGELVDLGFDSKDRLIALSLKRPTPEESRAGEVSVDGAQVGLEDARGEGESAVAVALSYEEGAWKRVELKVTTEGGEHSPGVGALPVARDLGYRSTAALEPRVKGDTERRNKVLDALRAYAPDLTETEGSWIRLGYGGNTAEVWESSGEIPFSTGLMVFLDEGRLVKPAQYPYGVDDIVALRARGLYLLVSQDDVGAHPRLYRGPQLVWTSDTARAVTFWPR